MLAPIDLIFANFDEISNVRTSCNPIDTPSSNHLPMEFIVPLKVTQNCNFFIRKIFNHRAINQQINANYQEMQDLQIQEFEHKIKSFQDSNLKLKKFILHSPNHPWTNDNKYKRLSNFRKIMKKRYVVNPNLFFKFLLRQAHVAAIIKRKILYEDGLFQLQWKKLFFVGKFQTTSKIAIAH